MRYETQIPANPVIVKQAGFSIMNRHTRAENLEEVYLTVNPEPLTDKSRFEAFYRPEINKLRGDDRIELMALELRRALDGLPYKAFFMGHPGVGKSTELTRLVQRIEDQYACIRLSATGQLDPISFQPFDVLLIMMAELVERTARPIKEGGAGQKPPDERLKAVWDWFADEKETIERARHFQVQAEAGLGVQGDSWWAKIMGLYASLRGEAKYASARKKEFVTYRLSRLSELIEAANKLIDQCNRFLRDSVGKEWLFIVEDFDRHGVPIESTENLFVTYGNVFKDLRAHWICVIPIALGYSPKANQFPVPQDRVHCLPDTPVYTRDHQPHQEGRNALRAILEARVSPHLFDEGQVERLIVASGGNLRDLFSLVSSACNRAILRKEEQTRIGQRDVDAAIVNLRTDYERRLGPNPYDRQPIPYEAKAERLKRIYEGDPTAEVPDLALYDLLRSRAVQEFNGERWFGVHPLVVDVLVRHGHLKPRVGETVRGGARD